MKTNEIAFKNKTIIRAQDFSLYEMSSFEYQIDKEFLKGKDLFVTDNSQLKDGESDKYYFLMIFDLKIKLLKLALQKYFLKNIFDRSENDPRLYGVSSNHQNGITTVTKQFLLVVKKQEIVLLGA